ncbi:acetate kinase [cyanobacterium endosymbiont of Rhopalodia gibberula]|uniref:acetate kinase n=1 Tax=cyanobacterium endosymbiont of Rhopalodia gibberula TaxID=1763363 RepID=UPI000DC73119|nr:acetate kinase [cyanobacterium endosymbiont of Rhopalodia gibberula]BBA79406.1 acetate kinase [cyanobacterium endosymbiont of Rhopalodia gibberula]
MKILIINAGSSSHKSCLYNLTNNHLPEHSIEPIWKANIDWTVTKGQGILTVKTNETKKNNVLNYNSSCQGIIQMLNTLIEGKTKVIKNFSEINIVGHRVVHGGTDYSEATLITPEVKTAIARLIPLAPTHNSSNIKGIKAIEKVLGNVPQVAVFDTAFHCRIPLKSAAYPIPYEWLEKGIRRYGFHGISHKYCAEKASQILNKSLTSLKLITCHLGNGCSLAAIKNGISIDTTMGFTPLEGLMMGTRSGSIDPSILIHLIRKYNFTANQLNTMLNKESGFQGVSGISADLRSIIQAVNEGNSRAQLAFDMYIHRLRLHLGAMLGSLGGLDTLVFTAGVGENSAIVREKTCEVFEFIGLKLDPKKNNDFPVDTDVATDDSTVRILIIHTEENWAIAQECWRIFNQKYLPL